MQSEENDTPQQIDGKLCAVKPEGGGFLRRLGKADQGGANSHQNIEN